MIPASVTPSVSANASGVGAVFPLIEPTSAELAEFGHLLGNFNQGAGLALVSTSAPTLSNGDSLARLTEANTPITPEGLLSTLEQGAQMALHAPQAVLAAPNQIGNQPSTRGLNQANDALSASLTEVMAPPMSMPQGQDKPLTQMLDTGYQQVDITNLAGDLLPKNPAITTGSTSNTGDTSNMMGVPNQPISLLAQNKDTGYQQVDIPNLAGDLLPKNPAITTGNASTKTTAELTTPTKVEAGHLPHLDVTVLTEDALLASQYTSVATGSEADILTTSRHAVPLGYAQLSTTANLHLPENKGLMSNHYAAAPVVVTTPTSVAVSENSMISRMTEGGDLSALVPLLGDNKAVVFASAVSTIAVASNGVMQAASSGVDMSSTAQALTALASTITANSTAGANSGSAQQEQHQASSQSERLMLSSEEAQSISDVELAADEFALVSNTPLTQTVASSILSAPLNLRQPQWAQDVAQRVHLMINQSMKELEVRLDPLGLGPMKIGLKLDEQQKAHLTLSAQHGVTREMLENALPRLKELLAQEGIELASATVNSGEKQSGNEQNGGQTFHQSASGLLDDAANVKVNMTVIASSEHLVDQFA